MNVTAASKYYVSRSTFLKGNTVSDALTGEEMNILLAVMSMPPDKRFFLLEACETYCILGSLSISRINMSGKRYPASAIYGLKKRGLLAKLCYKITSTDVLSSDHSKIFKFPLCYTKLKEYRQLDHMRACIALGVYPI